MAKMTCLQPFRYAEKLLNPGDVFEVKDSNHVKLLSLIRKAKLSEEGEPEESKSPSPKRRYKRRDMQADNV